MQRVCEADDSAALVVFLLRPEAGWLTGQMVSRPMTVGARYVSGR